MIRKLVHYAHIQKFVPIYLANFFFSISAVLIVYINSSYLGGYFSQAGISSLLIVSGLLNIYFFLITPRLLRRFGNRGFFMLFLLVQTAGVALLALVHAPIYAALGFVFYDAAGVLVSYSLDIFLEDASREAVTGSIRGSFLTVANLALIICPLLVSLLAPNGEFVRVYMLSLVFLIPVFFIGLFSFHKFKDSKDYGGFNLPWKRLHKDKNALRTILVRLVLNTFYCIMVIYLPIYLHANLGFTWQTIGIIFAFMLLPFIVFEIPAGWLADTWCGEKEMMTLGLFLIGCALLSMPFLPANPLFWTIALFISRTGAAFTEVTTESYFFKHVDKSDAGLISIFRLTWAGAYLIGPVLAGVSLYLFPYPAMFIILSFLVLDAMELSFHLRDTL